MLNVSSVGTRCQDFSLEDVGICKTWEKYMPFLAFENFGGYCLMDIQ